MLTKLKLIRLKKGLKAKEVARDAKIDASWYCRIENGQHDRGMPSLETMQALANVLDVPVDSIFKAKYECKV
jgi:transcriptional regulator with XRE-family HTH domain